MWTGNSSAGPCSQQKKGALRRQTRIDQDIQEQLQDPWVRLSESSPEALYKFNHHAVDNTKGEHIPCKTATMSKEGITQELNGTALNSTVDPPCDMAPENSSETPPGVKKGPPVAPKPAWFRQSLRKIRDEQDQKKQAVSFSRSFGVTSAPSAANLSIKQKIHSFETFSSPSGQEKMENRKPVAASTSFPLMEKETRRNPATPGDYGRAKDEVVKESQPSQSAPVEEIDSTTVTAKRSAITSCTTEVQKTVLFTEDELTPSRCLSDLPLVDTMPTDLDLEIHTSHSAQIHDKSSALPSKPESELESRPTDTKVLLPMTSLRFNQTDGAQHVIVAASTESHAQRGLEGESLGKILTFSNQVIYHEKKIQRCVSSGMQWKLRFAHNLS